MAESEFTDLAAAEARAAELRKAFGSSVGLVHGRLPPAEKDAVMEEFAEGRLAVLVATTVVEVGVDVPNASIMVIEQAERFGLAQLHQLRGRVGRGLRESSCVLLYDPPLARSARRGWTSCAAPTTASSSPRRTWSCAAAAIRWVCARAAFRPIASPTPSPIGT